MFEHGESLSSWSNKETVRTIHNMHRTSSCILDLQYEKMKLKRRNLFG